MAATSAPARWPANSCFNYDRNQNRPAWLASARQVFFLLGRFIELVWLERRCRDLSDMGLHASSYTNFIRGPIVPAWANAYSVARSTKRSQCKIASPLSVALCGMVRRYVWCSLSRNCQWPQRLCCQPNVVDGHPDSAARKVAWDFELAPGRLSAHPFTRRRSGPAGTVAGCADYDGVRFAASPAYPALTRLGLPHSPLLSWAGLLSLPSRGRAPPEGRPNRPAGGARTLKTKGKWPLNSFRPIEEVCHATR
jgi:hypothetical protein